MDNFQVLVGLNELFFEALLGADHNDGWIGFGDVDLLLPGAVNGLETLGFLWQLLHDIGRIKDGLEIHPLSLTFDPFFEGV